MAKIDMDPDCKVYVGELGNSASEEEIYEAFSHFGRIKAVWVARKPPGFAFVEFYVREEAEDSVKSLNNRYICGRRIKAEMCNGKSRWPNGRPPAHVMDRKRRPGSGRHRSSSRDHRSSSRISLPKNYANRSPEYRQYKSRSRSTGRGDHWKRRRSRSRSSSKSRDRSSSTRSSSSSSRSSNGKSKDRFAISNKGDAALDDVDVNRTNEVEHRSMAERQNRESRDMATDTDDLEKYDDDYTFPVPQVRSMAVVPSTSQFNGIAPRMRMWNTGRGALNPRGQRGSVRGRGLIPFPPKRGLLEARRRGFLAAQR